jgi:predicted acylesterase/phospholipase RssA
MDEEEPVSYPMNFEAVVLFLSKIELFKKITPSSLQDLAATLEFVYVQGETTLIKQGDNDTSMFILYEGRLRVYRETMTDEVHSKTIEEPIAEIAPGQFVGEIALLTHLPRTTTVRAVRDSILLELNEQAFKQFEINYPHEVVSIAKTALTRLTIKPKTTHVGENIVSLAIAPAGASNHRPFIERLINELKKTKSAVVVNREAFNRHFNVQPTAEIFEFDTVQITIWLRSLESQYDYIVYETDQEFTSWTQCCLKRADRIVFVADPAQSPTLNSIETMVFSDGKVIEPYTEVVFIHPDNQTIIRGTEQWLNKRPCDGFHHLKLNSQLYVDRFIRFLTGRAFGVVLNGGGARGLAHIGVLKALDELQIPIDFIGGASAGAFISGMYAFSGVSEAIKFSELHVHDSIRELTLPMMGLFKGKVLSDKCRSFFGEARIEDLWLRYFCVSTNVTQAKLQIHDKGPIWLAVRTSCSVPALYPPIYDEEYSMLIDGGVINNMPVDVMRKMICGGKILAVDCHMHAQGIVKRRPSQTWISGWKLFLRKMNPFNKEEFEYDNILDVILGAMDAGFSFQQNLMAKEADYNLQIDTNRYNMLDFPLAPEIIELGYRTAMEKLPGLLGLPPIKDEQPEST